MIEPNTKPPNTTSPNTGPSGSPNTGPSGSPNIPGSTSPAPNHAASATSPNPIQQRDSTPQPNPATSPAPTEPEPPTCLPRVPKLFWSVHPDFEKLIEIAPPETGKVLDALGPPPFPKAGFPFIGFLATVYEHVSHHTQLTELPEPPEPDHNE